MIRCNLAPAEILSEQNGRRRLRLMSAGLLGLLCLICVGEVARVFFEADLSQQVALRDKLSSEIAELTQGEAASLKARESLRTAHNQRRKQRTLHEGLAKLLTNLPRLVSSEASLTKIYTLNHSIILTGCAVYPEAVRQLREKLRAQIPNVEVTIDDISVEDSGECTHFQLSLTLDAPDTKSKKG